jgi:D-alanyl-D-alanine carboxypeptidase/D-alanyl-D-alanine-endopeptidase (penicillin-binding protein 4)
MKNSALKSPNVFFLALSCTLGLQWIGPQFAQAANAHQELQSQLHKILGSLASHSSLSVRDPQGQEWVNLNGKTARAPASIAKTVSTGCSLEALGPQFQFHTHLGFAGKIEGDALIGSLVLYGEGDPSLTLEDIREIIFKLRTLYSLRKISGPLIFDTSYLSEPQLHIGSGFEGDEGRSFATEITPFPLTQNSFAVWAVENPRTGANPFLTSVIPSEVFDFKLKTNIHRGSKSQIAVAYKPGQTQLSIDGTLASNDAKAIYRSVPDPYDYYNRLLHKLWSDAGGEWELSPARIEKKPVARQELWDNTSKPLAKILMDINKYSLNLGAELTLLAAAKGDSPSTSPEKATAFLQRCLAEHKIPAGGIQLVNASGLSREARIQASALSQFLNSMLASPYAPEYLSTFSLAGIDGTTKTRLQSLKGHARLKTGSIQGVSSIAGYLTPPNSGSFSVALIMNGVSSSDPKVKKTQDLVLDKVYRALSKDIRPPSPATDIPADEATDSSE